MGKWVIKKEDVVNEAYNFNNELFMAYSPVCDEMARLIDAESKQQTIEQLNLQYGLLFLYEGSGVASRAVSCVIHAFQKKYGWQVMADVLDGAPLPGLFHVPQPIKRKTFSSHEFPLLMAVHFQTRTHIALTQGIITLHFLEMSILQSVLKRAFLNGGDILDQGDTRSV